MEKEGDCNRRVAGDHAIVFFAGGRLDRTEQIRALDRCLAVVRALYVDDLKTGLGSPEHEGILSSEATLFMFAIGVMTFSKREITAKSISALFDLADISLNQEKISTLLTLKRYDYIPYVFIYYFLSVAGVEPNEDRLVETAGAMGISADVNVARRVLSRVLP